MTKKTCKLCDKTRYLNTSWCWEHYLAREKEKKAKKKLKDIDKNKVKKKTTKQIKKTLHDSCWKLMSKAVRLKGADSNGFNSCYTCGVVKHYKELQAGHYKHGRLDFDFRNLKPQCVKCNHFHSGRLDVYAEKLIKEYGVKWLDKLVQDAWKHTGY